MKLRARSNIDEVFRELDDTVEQMQTVAASRALNTLEGQAEVAGYRKIAEIYGLGVRVIERYASVQLATPTDLEASVTVKGPGFPLAVFQPNQTRKGVTVRMKGRRSLFPSTFLLRLPNGHVGVFARGAYGGKGSTALKVTGRIGRFVLGRGRRVKRANKWGSSELPINELYGPAPGDTFNNPDVVDAMADRVAEQAPAVFRRELDAVRRGF